MSNEAVTKKRIAAHAHVVSTRLLERARADREGADIMASAYLVGAVAFFMETTMDRRDLFAALTRLAEDAIADQLKPTVALNDADRRILK